MNNATFNIKVSGVDVEHIVKDIQNTVAQKAAAGEYNDALIARAERGNLFHMQDSVEFISYYMSCLSRCNTVDIRTFKIPDRKGGMMGKAMVKLKQGIWGMLKFYTYRMWSQQNQINSLIINGLVLLRNYEVKKFEYYDKRIARLEKALENAGINIPAE